ncbi:2OG-Fe dioxygenase family protein [Dyella caseinilytica]|uniref:2OG-Fe dioxygenase family protein n=1 Tax=Dyella caseinilytica TaxID=1849581 RepID=A0ABX7GQH7_9GAMM|nr:2OG-Fe dioxygenase family protein [Dyella caseinilytica]QRN52515.1 2OG-Fe dioxygenase family protein [Dyella caseinilytica]
MPTSLNSPTPSLFDAVQRDGFCFVTADTMQPLLQSAGGLSDWTHFAESWNRLGPDPYLAAKGRFRRRRHATFTARANGTIELAPHQPHFQSLQYNALQGDIERWFEPIEPAMANGASLRTILTFCNGFFSSLAFGISQWHVEVHQFRIEANTGEAGEPTPEGSHRDGVDFVLVLLVDRHNIASGTTSIHAPDGKPLGDFTLTRPLDSALIHDPRVFHGVTAVTPLAAGEEAHRDVLVVTFRAKP